MSRASGGCGSTSGGCDSTSGTGTVGSCTSECGGLGGLAGCNHSDEVLDPLDGVIDPEYMVDLRLMLRLALARSLAARVAALEAKLHPQTLQEVERLEGGLKDALAELEQQRKRIQTKG